MRRRTFLGAALTAGGGAAAAACEAGHRGTTRPLPVRGRCVPGGAVARQLRGTWIGSFKNLDWPSRPGLPASRQRRELAGLLDLARRLRLNAVLLQVRPTADALYPSRYEPWSKWLTGTQGRSPGYDPLEFAVSAAHERGLELHAWFNPYRVSERPGLAHLAAGHPARRNPGWVVEYGGQLWYDPGNPAVRALAVKVIGDVARRYRVDGIHLDDYFYPYPVPGEAFADHVTFRRYGTGFGSRAQWRRHNINLFVAEVCAEVRRVRPWAKFGVSPFGIWRNASSDPEGSPTAGLQAYDDLHADARAWIRRGWLDYVAPQLYWEIGNRAAPYEKLVRWWSRTVSQTSTELYIGQAAYLGETWHDPAEMSRHLAFDHRQPQVAGELFFHARSLGISSFGARLAGEDFAARAYPPLPPRIRRLLSTPTKAPTKAAAKEAAKAPGLPPSGWLRREAIMNCPHRQL